MLGKLFWGQVGESAWGWPEVTTTPIPVATLPLCGTQCLKVKMFLIWHVHLFILRHPKLCTRPNFTQSLFDFVSFIC